MMSVDVNLFVKQIGTNLLLQVRFVILVFMTNCISVDTAIVIVDAAIIELSNPPLVCFIRDSRYFTENACSVEHFIQHFKTPFRITDSPMVHLIATIPVTQNVNNVYVKTARIVVIVSHYAVFG